MLASQPQVAFDTPMQLGECPLWHPDEAALYWIDIPGQAVHRLDSGGGHMNWTMPSEPGCIAHSGRGRLLVALRTGLNWLDTASGRLQQLAGAPYDTSKQRFNDGRCDPAGRLWVGTIHEPRDAPLASLWCFDKRGMRDFGKPVTVSNGLAFSPDGRTLYHADTKEHRIMAWAFDPDAGTIGAGRIFRQFSSERNAQYMGRPDGAAVDSEGAYWCAMFEGSRLLRLSASGDVLAEVALPVRCPTMLAFGGADLRTLYVTSAGLNRPQAELEQYPLSGRLLSLRVDVPGLPEPAFQP